MKKKVVFLANALSGYFIACLNKLTEQESVEVHVVKYPVDSVAPFRFDLGKNGITYYNRNDFNDGALLSFVQSINPDLILCSGWADKGYLNVCKYYRKEIRTVLKFDNPWRNTIRQNIGAFAGTLYLKKYFEGCWVSGLPQRIYARKLGFAESEICEGFYSCDVDFFNALYQKHKSKKGNNFPKKFLFIGRYTPLKGILELWKAFVQFQKEKPGQWELWCLGKGDLKKDFPHHDKIKDFGFVQPAEMDYFVENTGVFVLPAHYEHWGVVVHECAAAGFPLICSTTTSSANAYLQDGFNGFYHKPKDVRSLEEAFHKISGLSDSQLSEMGDNSTILAQQITPVIWSKIVWKFLGDEKFPQFRFMKEKLIENEKIKL